MLTINELKNDSNLPVVIANDQGIVIDINHHFEKVFGWNQEELVGQMLSIILPSYFRDAHHLGFSRFNTTGNATILNHPLILKAVTKDNREIESEHFIIAEKHEDKWIFAASIRPIAE
ncbi:PAS domain S-box protein [Calothrix sp. PCC 6303]|uniref:PAS domain S-box protein n=1 Tax=Calothrix sp. PCC 6303 TaxID=1170562 RepID=UPI0002A05658|nr:PAS domain S-box protein [Calothrix sp. PCC 6303]AFZ03004.1 PAS fold domain protein [Calothrix sp. PCC 6303]